VWTLTDNGPEFLEKKTSSKSMIVFRMNDILLNLGAEVITISIASIVISCEISKHPTLCAPSQVEVY